MFENEPSRLKVVILVVKLQQIAAISRNLVIIYRKYCNLTGYRTRYLSGDR